ncbi:PAS domain S-box protein [Ammoniphilus sp. CFH 90114]|uniref:SpoIIE family protein phosphatase n=1 Tax=Ammoniphilus sp. CFH 90114 TaxID=2493665 RepID=UPI0013E98987|nr:PAS domain S-box protein [Ammoniphilus sp. CFH 90114]
MYENRNNLSDLTFNNRESSKVLWDMKYALDASAIVAITDRKGIITYVNEKFCILSQYTSDELIGRTHAVVNSGYHPRTFFSDMWRSISKGEIWEGDIQNKAKDGSLYWVSTVIVPLLGEDKIPYQYISFRRDITEKKNLEITLQLAYKVYQNMDQGIIITDPTGTILNVNKAYCTITGYSPKELLGQNPKILKSDLHDQSFYYEVWKNLKEKGRWTGEIWNRHKNGHLYLQKLSLTAIRDERDHIIHYLGVSTDISEKEKLRKDIIATGKLQRTLLPPPIDNQWILVDSVYAPANYVSGDFYDYYWDEEQGVLSGYLMDIMGHGLTAALQNSVLRVLFRQTLNHTKNLVEVLSVINKDSMNYFLEGTFAAALTFRLDVKRRTFTFACAGLNKFLRLNTKGEIIVEKQGGPYLGILEDVIFEERTIVINPGEAFYLLTDGFMDLFEIDLPSFSSEVFKENMEMLRNIGTQGLNDDATAIGIMSYPYGEMMT